MATALESTVRDGHQESIRILVVDDHPLMRRALATLIGSHEKWEICGETATVSTANRLARELKPDVMIVDLVLGDGSGIELIKEIKSELPSIRMIALSMHDEMLYAERAIRAGAMGYVSKQAPAETILAAIEQVLRGELHLSHRIEAHLLSQVPRRARGGHNGPVSQLSDRELQTFEMIGDGMTTRAIAERLQVSVKTIDAYRQRIKSKLKLQTSNELMRRAVEWSLDKQ